MSKQRTNIPADQQYNKRLKGTFISVLVIGAFILIAWLAVFLFYINTV